MGAQSGDPLPVGEALDPRYWVEALARGLAVLQAFDDERRSLSLTELAQHLGWSRSEPYRLVYTLERLGYLQRDGQLKRYCLGPRVLQLGFAYLHGLPLVEQAQPLLAQLSQAVGQSAHLGILDGRQVVYVAGVSARRIAATHVNVGARLPAHATALGKVLLAHLPSAELETLLASPLEQYTERTVAEPAALRAALQQARAAGYVINDQEFERGIAAVAAPVFDVKGRVVAAVNVSVLAAALADEAARDALRTAVCRTAAQLSTYLGYQPPALRDGLGTGVLSGARRRERDD